MPLLSLPLSAGTCFFEAALNLTGHTFDEGEGAIAFEATGFILQVLITCYACLGLALACDDYFVASLEILIERLALPPDVAGATFMAAGTSSPELFVAAVTVFFPAEEVGANTGELEIHKDPGLGVGTVIGSTMFNTLCIVGGSAIVSGGMVKLDWRIVLRDAGGYAVAIAVLSMCIVDETCDAFSVRFLHLFSMQNELSSAQSIACTVCRRRAQMERVSPSRMLPRRMFRTWRWVEWGRVGHYQRLRDGCSDGLLCRLRSALHEVQRAGGPLLRAPDGRRTFPGAGISLDLVF